MTSITIVGGGLMGLSAAFHLRRADPTATVTVLERARVGDAASGASAAGVRALGRDPAERAMALESLRRWPDLDRDLGGRTHYQRGGGLRIAADPDAWRDVPAWVADQRTVGVPVEIVDRASAMSLAPGLTPECLGGVYCPIDGHAEAQPTVDAFAAAARRAGAHIDEGVGVRALTLERGRVIAVTRTDGTSQPCDVAIVAAGAWTATLLAGVGVHLSLETRALQMLLTEPAPKELTPVLGCFNRGLSLKQLDDGRYLIGGGWPARITDDQANRYEVLDESVRGSLGVASGVYSPVAKAGLARSWAGLEAFTRDGLPVIGPIPGIDGLLVATGFSGHGFALSPVVGDVLARLALGRDPLAHLWDGLRYVRGTGGGHP